MIERERLRAFMQGFYGYGTYSAPFWLIGIEEGGGASCDEIERRLAAWEAHGRPAVDDLATFHEAAKIAIDTASPQSTWGPLIQLVLTATNSPATPAVILEYQRTFLGRRGGETCLLELLPLPKRNARDWRYDLWTDLPELRNRAQYERSSIPHRSDSIIRALNENRPRVALFYGRRKFWRQRLKLSGSFENPMYDSATIGPTTLILTDHPAAWSNDATLRFTQIGESLRSAFG
jgi:hypothetical protein